MSKGTTYYKGMMIVAGKKPVWYLGANGKFKKGYDPVYKVFEMENAVTSVFVDSAVSLAEAKKIVDKIKEV